MQCFIQLITWRRPGLPAARVPQPGARLLSHLQVSSEPSVRGTGTLPPHPSWQQRVRVLRGWLSPLRNSEEPGTEPSTHEI